MSNSEMDDQLRVARFMACQKAPYLRVALFRLRPVCRPGLDTFGVDKYWRMYYDPQKIEEWGIEATAGVLLHEVSHLLRQHATRGEPFEDKVRWNIAADLEINDDLVCMAKLPKGALLPSDFHMLLGQLSEFYYDKLPYYSALRLRWESWGPFGDKPNAGQQDPPTCGSGATGVAAPWELPDDGQGPNETEQKRIRLQVAQEIQAIGNVPGNWKVWAEAVLRPPKVPWQRVLQSRLAGTLKKAPGAYDWTYSRPSRRHAGQGKVILPGMYQPQIHVAVVADTSGSMGSKEGSRVLSEVEGICRALNAPVHVLACDTVVHNKQLIRRAKEAVMTGGGGTDMTVGIREAERLSPQPGVIVVLTDGWTDWPDKPTRIPVIACLVRRPQNPPPRWMQVVHAYND